MQFGAIIHQTGARDMLFVCLQQHFVALPDFTGHLQPYVILTFASHGKPTDAHISLWSYAVPHKYTVAFTIKYSPVPLYIDSRWFSD